MLALRGPRVLVEPRGLHPSDVLNHLAVALCAVTAWPICVSCVCRYGAMPGWWRTVEQLVPEHGPTSTEGSRRLLRPAHAEKSATAAVAVRGRPGMGSPPRGRPRRSERNGRCSSGESGPILLGGVARRVENRLCCGTTAGHGLRDPLPLHRVHKACGIAHQKDPPPGGRGPDDPHLEPAAETAWRAAIEGAGLIEEASAGHAGARGNRAAPGPHGRLPGTVSPRPDTEPDVGNAPLPREDPAVTGEGSPRRRLPQDDGREIDHLWQVRAHGKTPQNRVGIDETHSRRNLARGPVGADHEVGVQRLNTVLSL